MDVMTKELLHFIIYNDERPYAFEPSDLVHLLGSSHLAMKDIDRMTEMIKDVLHRNQRWHNDLETD